MKSIQEKLFEMRDEEYKKFSQKLIPTVNPDTVIGVRTPVLRAYAKEIFGTEEAEEFIKDLPHTYCEENNLHAFIVEKINDYNMALKETEIFLPYIDNWATCDVFVPKIFRKHTAELIKEIKRWLKSDKVYTVRYAIGLLMGLYLDDHFNAEYLEMAVEIRSEEYYINMMIAWYFATALAKQYDSAILYIINNRLSPWVHNKTIQKATESNRISNETKEYLKTLKIKK